MDEDKEWIVGTGADVTFPVSGTSEMIFRFLVGGIHVIFPFHVHYIKCIYKIKQSHWIKMKPYLRSSAIASRRLTITLSIKENSSLQSCHKVSLLFPRFTMSEIIESFELEELIPGLPEDLAVECVARLSFTSLHSAYHVCRRWKEFLRSDAFHSHREAAGFTRKLACLVQAAGVPSTSKTTTYRIVLFDPIARSIHQLDPILKYQGGLPLFCQMASCDGKLVVMGGWNPITYDSIPDVFVYDFVTGLWKEGTPMPDKRSFHAIAAGSTGKVYVSGGHDDNKNALSSAWVYDVRGDKWTQIPRMSKERDECEGFVAVCEDGSEEFWVVSGYATESQGSFLGDAEVYDTDAGAWRLEEGAWKAGRCPRGSAGLVRGEVVCWADVVGDDAPKMGPNVVSIGNRLVATGSDHQSGWHGFYLIDLNGGKMEKVEADEMFSGFVQSSCCVEI